MSLLLLSLVAVLDADDLLAVLEELLDLGFLEELDTVGLQKDVVSFDSGWRRKISAPRSSPSPRTCRGAPS